MFQKLKNSRISETIDLLRRFQPILPRPSLLTTYKTFIRSQLDYADVIYDQAYHSYLHEKLDLTPYLNTGQETRHSNNISAIHVRRDYFKNSFFPSLTSKWNKRDWKIRDSGSLSIFKKNLLNLIRPCTNSIFDIHNSYGIKFLTRLRQGLSHLGDHKFRHCFQDTLNPLCDYGNDTETITQFFLRCPRFHTPRQTLLNNIRNINEQILSQGEDQLIQTFLYGNPNCNLTVNRLMLNATI